MVATCTGGERGSILNPKMDRPEVLANITEIRRQEMDAAREILGIRQEWLGWVDSGFPEGDPPPPLPEGCFAALKVEDAAAPLVKLIREFRPQVVTTYDENGGYPHPDHVMCHQITVAAFEAAGDPDAYPGARRTVAAAEAVLPPHLPPRADEGAARRDGRARPGVAVRRSPEGLEAGPGERAPDHHPGRVRRVLRASGTGRCSPTRPRSTRTARGSPYRWRCTRRPGRPRTTSWPAVWSSRNCLKTTCSRGCADGGEARR